MTQSVVTLPSVWTVTPSNWKAISSVEMRLSTYTRNVIDCGSPDLAEIVLIVATAARDSKVTVMLAKPPFCGSRLMVPSGAVTTLTTSTASEVTSLVLEPSGGVMCNTAVSACSSVISKWTSSPEGTLSVVMLMLSSLGFHSLYVICSVADLVVSSEEAVTVAVP